uniref:Uncharacterized protein n=1 Tax=Rangifer tarandus platyrhynchus TaxID=3082113 RepID=A0ACB0E3U8_RANTA|nr:unnamed protein product [Rangifer tarandus platyrhynchus]
MPLKVLNILQKTAGPLLTPTITTKGLPRNESNQRIVRICKSPHPRKAVFTQRCALLPVLSLWAWLSSERSPSVSSQPLVDNSGRCGSRPLVPALSPAAVESGECKEGGQAPGSFWASQFDAGSPGVLGAERFLSSDAPAALRGRGQAEEHPDHFPDGEMEASELSAALSLRCSLESFPWLTL